MDSRDCHPGNWFFVCKIELEDRTVVRKHHDQVVVRPVEGPRPAVTLPFKSPLSVDSGIILPDTDPPEGICGDSESPKNTEAAVSGSTTPVRRYPVRNRNPRSVSSKWTHPLPREQC